MKSSLVNPFDFRNIPRKFNSSPPMIYRAPKGKYASNYPFSGARLNFRGVVFIPGGQVVSQS